MHRTSKPSGQARTGQPSPHLLLVIGFAFSRPLAGGRCEALLSRDPSAFAFTANAPAQWFQLDLGPYRLVPTVYTLRTRSDNDRSHVRTWYLEASRDARTWVTMRRHVDDRTLDAVHPIASWAVHWKPVGPLMEV